jgi:RNA polymerase sigma-70 factor (ECF subfamily)
MDGPMVVARPRLGQRSPVRHSGHDALLDDLAMRAQRGDAGASARLCVEMMPLLKRYLASALGKAQDTEDATQQVLLRVLEALPRYRASGTPVRHWVITIAHNHLLDRARSDSRVTVTEIGAVSQEIEARQREETAETPSERRDSFRALIAPLKLDQQKVLLLLVVYDFTPEQAGRLLDRTAASVRQLHKRGLDALRRLIADAADEHDLRPRGGEV